LVDKSEKWISDLVGALFDPIIVHQCAWMDMTPDWLKAAIKMERLIEIAVARKEKRDITGTDAEAMAYLHIASLEFPFDHDWTEIYMYVFTRTYNAHRSKDSEVTVPDDIRQESLNNQQMQDLKRLKDWIYRIRVRHRQEKDRVERRERREEEVERKKKEQFTFEFVK
jgi:hypothetical protein